MELNVSEHTARKTYSGVGIFSAGSGEKIEIEICGEKELEVTVPDGKNWERIEIHVHVVETNA